MNIGKTFKIEFFNKDHCEIDDLTLEEMISIAYDEDKKEIYPEVLWLFLEGVKKIYNFNQLYGEQEELFNKIIEIGKGSIKEINIKYPISVFKKYI